MNTSIAAQGFIRRRLGSASLVLTGIFCSNLALFSAVAQESPFNSRLRVLGTSDGTRGGNAPEGEAAPRSGRISPRGTPPQQDPGADPLFGLADMPPTGIGSPDPLNSADYGRYVEQTIDPEATLELYVGRPRVLSFRSPPRRIYLASDSVASYDVISESEIAVVGESVGRTVLLIWIDDPESPERTKVLSYLVRVREDETYTARLEEVYRRLEQEINRDFPDSGVKLSLVGNQLVVRGQAKDVVEASHILQILSEHAPPERRRNSSREAELQLTSTEFSPDGLSATGASLGMTLEDLSTSVGLDVDGNIINLLTIPGEQQVMLRVTVAEVNRSALRSIGTNLRVDGTSGFLFDTSFPPRLGDLPTTAMMGVEGGTLGLARGDFRLTVDALKQHNLARTLAEPNLVTLHGRPARFQAGGQFPVPSARVGFGSAAQGVEFVPFGVQLQFIPFIVDRDRIRLTVAANVSTRDESLETDVGGSNVPGINSRNFQNTVELREGQTLAVAGLIQTNFGSNSVSIPGLGDIPVVGRLFRSDSTSADEQELLILITPELVHPIDAAACLPLPGDDVYEPSDVEFYLKGLIEGRRTDDYRSPVRTDAAKLRRYRRAEDTFIIGPHGHSDGRSFQGTSGAHFKSGSGSERWGPVESLPPLRSEEGRLEEEVRQ